MTELKNIIIFSTLIIINCASCKAANIYAFYGGFMNFFDQSLILNQKSSIWNLGNFAGPAYSWNITGVTLDSIVDIYRPDADKKYVMDYDTNKFGNNINFHVPTGLHGTTLSINSAYLPLMDESVNPPVFKDAKIEITQIEFDIRITINSLTGQCKITRNYNMELLSNTEIYFNGVKKTDYFKNLILPHLNKNYSSQKSFPCSAMWEFFVGNY